MNVSSSSPGFWDSDNMAELRREFGISRKIGRKILNCYNDVGLEGLTDRSRRPYRQDDHRLGSFDDTECRSKARSARKRYPCLRNNP